MTRPIRMLLEGNGGGSLKPKIPLYVSGFGPRAMGLAGLHGDGLVFAIPPRGVPVAQALAHARQGATRANRELDAARFHTCALTNVELLQPGEAVGFHRVKAAIGPNVMASVYYFYDEVQERGIDPPPFLARIWPGYCALVEQTPPPLRHLRRTNLHYTSCISKTPTEPGQTEPERIGQGHAAGYGGVVGPKPTPKSDSVSPGLTGRVAKEKVFAGPIRS